MFLCFVYLYMYSMCALIYLFTSFFVFFLFFFYVFHFLISRFPFFVRFVSASGCLSFALFHFQCSAINIVLHSARLAGVPAPNPVRTRGGEGNPVFRCFYMETWLWCGGRRTAWNQGPLLIWRR